MQQVLTVYFEHQALVSEGFFFFMIIKHDFCCHHFLHMTHGDLLVSDDDVEKSDL